MSKRNLLNLCVCASSGHKKRHQNQNLSGIIKRDNAPTMPIKCVLHETRQECKGRGEGGQSERDSLGG